MPAQSADPHTHTPVQSRPRRTRRPVASRRRAFALASYQATCRTCGLRYRSLGAPGLCPDCGAVLDL